MSNVRVPILLDGPHDRLYIVLMDGTGNSRDKSGPGSHTVVARLSTAIEELKDPAMTVAYLPGVGTQDGFVARAIDGATGGTLRMRAEHAYYKFCLQVKQWLDEDPHVRVRLAATGFSRGAETEALLARLVHERGVRDPSGVTAEFGGSDVLNRIAWQDVPPLMAPGTVPTAMLMIDPVGTGQLHIDRAVMSSNVSLVQLTSMHEGRKDFSSTLHAPVGLSDQGRVANILLPGAHSDLGGSYVLDGVGRVVYNFQAEYFNTLLGGRRLDLLPEPFDPRLYAVHRSEQHLLGLWPDGASRLDGGQGVHQNLGPSCRMIEPTPCTRSPIDYRIADDLRFEYLNVGRHPGGTDAKMEAAMAAADEMYRRDPGLLDSAVTHTRLPGRAQVLQKSQELGELFDELVESARRRDFQGMKEVAALFRATPAGMLIDNIGAARKLLEAAGEQVPSLSYAAREREEGVARGQHDEALVPGR